MGQDDCVCEECPEWPLSMADMMTNLLCFFVLLVSIANFDETKFQAISDAMQEAMGGENKDAMFSESEQAAYELKQTIQLIMQDLNVLFEGDKDVTLEYRKNAVAIKINNDKGKDIFKPGQAVFTRRAYDVLERVRGVMEGIPFPVTVEGHTDNVPVTSQLYPSNWELSGARAAAVARYFIERGLDKNAVRVVGRADTEPIASNRTRAGRSVNRRIVIVVSPS
ncbi:MAG: chemotaxis protein MotB [Candidatus Magnetoglobus multicellularis str. Araruama]|uniref:Chemotaxis protein MotB n=1 Tax=Candidatus Magnetoglobus multicellularis str. Araruama TaxID=890399 RepID=A0A1V1PBT5_9BACT|nr:MAG: chemotaxis protein MotB [Candidatus Magnetoglobus multicellularis str. Araruama]